MAKKKVQPEMPKTEVKVDAKIEDKPVVTKTKGLEKILTEKQKEGKLAIIAAKKKIKEFIANRKAKPAPAMGVELAASVVTPQVTEQIEPKVTGMPKAASESVAKLVAEKNKIRQEYTGKLFPAEIVKRLEEIETLIKA